MTLKNGMKLSDSDVVQLQNEIVNSDLKLDIQELTGYPVPDNGRDMRRIWLEMLEDKKFEEARAQAEKRAVQQFWLNRFQSYAGNMKEFLAQLDKLNLVTGVVEKKHYTYNVSGNKIALVEGRIGFPAQLLGAYIKKNVSYTFLLDDKPLTPVGLKVDVEKGSTEIKFEYA